MMLSTAAVLVTSMIVGQANGATPMPDSVRKQLDSKIIGTWVLEATFEGKSIKGGQTWSWSGDNLRVNLRGFMEDKGDTTIYGGVMGWDGIEGALVVQTFGSDGTTGTIQWKELGDDKWTGEWSGTYEGTMSSSRAKLEFKGDHNRYEDMTNGKPWVTIAKRKMEIAKPSNYDKIKDLGYFVGTWESVQPNGATTIWTFKWAVDKNMLDNTVTKTMANGNVAFSNKGMLGWDAENRRITNWCFDKNGNPINFLWARAPDGNWDNWLSGAKSTWKVIIDNESTWRMVGGGDEQVYKRK